MTTKPGEQLVQEAVRDKVFVQIRGLNNNNICIDCEKKNPTWASIHLGIHLCMDCAGSHRQWGVQYSFVKSINLDKWNRKQLLFMEKGGNSRALQYFNKRGVITANNRHIDYKSPIVQQYKALLSGEVEMELSGVVRTKPVQPEKKAANDFFNELENQGKVQQKKIEIPHAQAVEEVIEKPKKKKDKKTFGKRIVIQDFQNIAFDNGVATEQKQKIIKQYEKKKDVFQPAETATQSTGNGYKSPQIAVPKIEQPKELSQQQINKKMEELKLQSNLKNISSESFKDTSIDNNTLKQNLNKFSGSTSISSSAFFNKEEPQSSQVVENVKDFVSNAGGKLIDKLSSYWQK